MCILQRVGMKSRVFIILVCALSASIVQTQEDEQRRPKPISAGLGIHDKKRERMISKLRGALASECILFMMTMKFRWNVTGANFVSLHQLFAEQTTLLLKCVDRIARRIRALGEFVDGTLEELVKASLLQEDTGVYPDDVMVSRLLNAHEAVIRSLRDLIDDSEDVNDAGTNIVLSEIIEEHETMAWILRSHIA